MRQKKLREVVGWVDFERDDNLQQCTTAKKLEMKI